MALLVPSISTVIILIAIYYAISGLSFPFTYALIVMGAYSCIKYKLVQESAYIEGTIEHICGYYSN